MKIQNTSLTTKELRDFGLTFGVIFALLFGLLLPWFFDVMFPTWPWWVLAATATLAMIYPLGLKLFYKVWMLFGGVMGWINTRLILGFVFYFVFMPFGFVMKILGKDPLSRKFDSTTNTYRIVHNGQTKNNMRNPF